MNPLNIAIYSRKSRFSDKSESTDNQINLCSEYCKTHFDKKLNFSIYEDEGYSGKNTHRPAFQQMNKDILAKQIDVVVCYKLDRISRDVSDFNILIKQLEKLGVDFICIKEQFDTTTPMGRAMMNISATFAQLERETIGERITDNLIELSRQGRFISSKAPFGYNKLKTTYIDKNGKEKKMNILTTNNEEMEVVKLVFEKYLELESINKVTSYFLINGYKTRNGNNYSLSSIRRILSNQYYCCADKTSYDYFVRNGATIISDSKNWTGEHGVSVFRRVNSKTKLPNDKDKLIYSVGSHEWFIQSSIWVQVQDIMLGRRNLSRRRDKSTVLLSGILKCSKCGSYMRPQSHQKNGSFYYVCELKEKSHKKLCDNKNIRGDLLDKTFIIDLQNSLKNEYSTSSIFNINIPKQTCADKSAEFQNQIIANNQKIEETKKNISKLILNMTKIDDEISIDYITKEIRALNKTIEEVKDDNNILSEKLITQKLNKLNSDLIDENISILLNDDFAKETDVLKKRKVIKGIIKFSYWNGNILTVEFL